MKCIFICIFDTNILNSYITVLESIYTFGNISDDIEILIYTTTLISNIIKDSSWNRSYLQFEINDNYDIYDNLRAKFDFFLLSSNIKYDNIIYFDTNIIITNDINILFNECKDNILYCLMDDPININDKYWCKPIFGEDYNLYLNKNTIAPGVLMFSNSIKINRLFINIKEDMIVKKHFYDQPFIIYHAFKNNVYENSTILNYIDTDNSEEILENKILKYIQYTEKYITKLCNNEYVIKKLKNKLIDKIINDTKEYITNFLLPIINEYDEELEGNLFMCQGERTFTDIFIDKIKNICEIIITHKPKTILEIGFNSGFSALLILFSNSELNLTCVDWCKHEYTKPCYMKIKETFGERITLISGSSIDVLPTLNNKYNLIHIDGSHHFTDVINDINNSYKLSEHGTIIIFDDYNFTILHIIWNIFIQLYKLENLNMYLRITEFHDIKYIKEYNIPYDTFRIINYITYVINEIFKNTEQKKIDDIV